jgi:Skp family chaperone for outer membrane proteins
MRKYYGAGGAIVVGIVVWLAAGANAATGGDIAFVSAQRILTESSEAKAGNARLEALRQKKAGELAAKQKALEAARLEVAQTGGVFSASKRAKAKADEERLLADAKHAAEQAQGEFQTMQRQIQTELSKHLGVIVAQFAQERRLRLVLNSDTAVVWAQPGNDLTAEVLAKLNAQQEKAKGTP